MASKIGNLVGGLFVTFLILSVPLLIWSIKGKSESQIIFDTQTPKEEVSAVDKLNKTNLDLINVNVPLPLLTLIYLTVFCLGYGAGRNKEKLSSARSRGTVK